MHQNSTGVSLPVHSLNFTEGFLWILSGVVTSEFRLLTRELASHDWPLHNTEEDKNLLPYHQLQTLEHYFCCIPLIN